MKKRVINKNNLENRLVSPVLMWLIVIIGITVICFLPGNQDLFLQSDFGKVIFVLCFLYWFYIFFEAVIVHKKAAVSVGKIDRLIKVGVYSRVRHPIYSGDMVFGIGIFFIFPNLKVLLSIVWLISVLIIWMNLEEHKLIEKFDKEYLHYKLKVPMFVPRIYKKKDWVSNRKS